MKNVELLILFVAALAYIKLIVIRAVDIYVDPNKSFERARRIKQGDKSIIRENDRAQASNALSGALYILEILSLIIVLTCLIVVYGWFLGSVIGLLLFVLLQPIARITFVRKMVQKGYTTYELHIMRIISKLQPIVSLFHTNIDRKAYVLESKDELAHLIETSDLDMSRQEKDLLTHALRFEDKVIKDSMTPRSVVEVVKDNETLGPLVLDRLHKTGFSRFPVVHKDLDHVIGMLYAHDFMTNLSSEQTVSVTEAMNKTVFYIHELQSLMDALAAFLRTKHLLFIVVNEFEETVGVISIEDVIEALIGRKIVDEFDQYEDLRTVAHRAAQVRHKSNHSTK